MKVSHIIIDNVLGVEHLEIHPGKVTLLKGQNATGKTSVIEALKALVKGGSDVTLLRQGAREGEVVLVMDDGMTIRKRITESGSTVRAHHPAYGGLRAAQTWIKQATDQLAVNPVAFLTDPRRVDRLLEAIPMDPDFDALKDLLEGVALDLPSEAHATTHALSAISMARKVVYDERTGVNRVKKDAEGSVRQLHGSLPDEPPPAAEDLDRLADNLQHAENVQKEQLHRTDLTQQSRLHEITERAAEEKAAIDARVAKERQKVIEEMNQTREGIRERNQPEIARLGETLATAREQAKQAKAYDNTRAIIADQERKAERAARDSQLLTDVLAALDRMRATKTSSLPVAGLEIRDGEIWLDGIPFPRLNRAKQIALAVEVAKLRTGEVPLVCLDGLENLDEERFDLLVEALSKADLQAIITTVSEDVELQQEVIA